MENQKSRASLFVFTSFQGGIGKSSIAWKFCQMYQSLTGLKGAFIELNPFTPSFLIEQQGLGDKIKSSFMDFYMSNWPGFNSQSLPDTFTEQKNLLLIPFSGNRTKETLKPPFTFSESETIPAFQHLLNVLQENKMFVVLDLPMAFTPIPLELLKRADAVYYLYKAAAPSPAFGKRFRFEMELHFPKSLNKFTYIRNHVDPEKDDLDFCLFEREYPLPVSKGLEQESKDERFDKALEKVVRQALSLSTTEKLAPEVIAIDQTNSDRLRDYQRQLRSIVVAALERGYGLSDTELRRKVEESIEGAMKKVVAPLISGVDVPAETRRYLLDEILGLGPLEEFMRDPEVGEIMVNGPTRIFIEKHGRLEPTNKAFNNADHVKAVIDRILMPVGRTLNERTPYVDARLTDGSRVHAIIPPLSLTGPMLTIRRFSREPFTLEDLIYRFKTLTPEAAEFLKMAVRFRRNIIVSGSASSGKTTLLNVLSTEIPATERLICIEDSAELRLNQDNLGRLEARQQGTEAKNQVTIRDLLRNALRMRPDRIIIGECRGDEALDMLQAMNTGHDGSLTTLHANSTRDALARLETMVLMAGVDLPLRAIREQIASSVNIVVQTTRFSDGSRRVLEIAEVTGLEDNSIQTQPIFQFQKKWINESGTVYGELIPSGYLPAFLRKMPGPVLEQTSRLFEQKA